MAVAAGLNQLNAIMHQQHETHRMMVERQFELLREQMNDVQRSTAYSSYILRKAARTKQT